MIKKAGKPRKQKRQEFVASGVSKVTSATDKTSASKSGKKAKKRAHVSAPKSGQRRLLWVGDAVARTGFATVTHSILESLHKQWDVVVSGINYRREPHNYPYTILPAQRGSDMWGVDHFPALCEELQPAVVVINNDWWNVAEFLVTKPQVPVIAYMPVDGKNLAPRAIKQLNSLDAAIWYTEFGRREAEQAGYEGLSSVIPHGVDERLYEPVPKQTARRQLGLRVPYDAFVVGNVNRNQPRKRLDLTIQYFAEWIQWFNVANAYLCLHCAQEDIGWDLRQLAEYYRIADRVVFSGPASLENDFAVDRMPLVYNSLDVQVTTTLGEGWGLTTMEGMMCGVPQIVPEWSALAEWPKHVVSVPCTSQFAHPEVNTIGGVPDKEAFIRALNDLYSNSQRRRQLGELGRQHVSQPSFRWNEISGQFHQVLQQVTRREAVLN